MDAHQKVNILLVDDQPAKLLSYEVILAELGENLVKAGSAREALEQLLRHDIAVVLVDVVMPDLDGFQLAALIREHPRFEKTPIIFISAIMMSDMDRLRGYQAGAVDYVPVPVVPEVLRAKVRVFAELHRKTKQLEALNRDLERRVSERTEALEASGERLRQSEERRSLALAAGQMGSWDWNLAAGTMAWDAGQCRIFGVDPDRFRPTPTSLEALIHAEDRERMRTLHREVAETGEPRQEEFRIVRPDGEVRWCFGTVVATGGAVGGGSQAGERATGLSGVVLDITERKKAEHRQSLLVREVDHRAKNALAVVQSVLRLTKADDLNGFVQAVEGRIRAIASVHTLLSESRWEGADLARLARDELAPYQTDQVNRLKCQGPALVLRPATAQTLALALHELATNAAKYGALSVPAGKVSLTWALAGEELRLSWRESGGPATTQPRAKGFGLRVISASIERQLSGKVVFDWLADGLSCTITLPATDVVTPPEEPPGTTEDAQVGGTAEATPALPPAPRVLLVEDEALVGLMMEQVLADFGAEVDGPVGNLPQALARAGSASLDCAILDVNLDGAAVYPVADVLADRGIPFVFLTGYDAGVVEGRHARAPVLQKPVEAAALRTTLATLLAPREAKRLAVG